MEISEDRDWIHAELALLQSWIGDRTCLFWCITQDASKLQEVKKFDVEFLSELFITYGGGCSLLIIDQTVMQLICANGSIVALFVPSKL